MHATIVTRVLIVRLISRTCKKEHQYEEIFDSLSLSLSPAEMELISAAGRSAPPKRRYALKVWGDAASTGYVR